MCCCLDFLQFIWRFLSFKLEVFFEIVHRRAHQDMLVSQQEFLQDVSELRYCFLSYLLESASAQIPTSICNFVTLIKRAFLIGMLLFLVFGSIESVHFYFLPFHHFIYILNAVGINKIVIVNNVLQYHFVISFRNSFC